jgi:hypothetical protein
MTFQPYQEPLRTTLLRTGIIALAAGDGKIPFYTVA